MELIAMLKTFTLTVFAWIFFRAENIHHAFIYIKGIFSNNFFNFQQFNNELGTGSLKTLFLIFIFSTTEWLGRKDKFAIKKILLNIKRPFRVIIYYLIIILVIFFFLTTKNEEFIYFQF